jgi:hypothetical protein
VKKYSLLTLINAFLILYGIESVRSQATGNIGIGTAAPATKLEVSSSFRVTPGVAETPCSPATEAAIYYDANLKEYCFCNGQRWVQLDGGGNCDCLDLDEDGWDDCLPGQPYGDGLLVDCDDQNLAIYPSSPEICDGLDNDCDGLVDDNPVDGTIYYRDFDQDGWGDQYSTINACSQPAGYVSWSVIFDCNDYDPNSFPGATEICDNLDNDCNGAIDDNPIDPVIYYADNDGDGYGAGMPISSCTMPLNGYSYLSNDCDDIDPLQYPGAEEICGDNIDNDCDGIVDEGC